MWAGSTAAGSRAPAAVRTPGGRRPGQPSFRYRDPMTSSLTAARGGLLALPLLLLAPAVAAAAGLPTSFTAGGVE